MISPRARAFSLLALVLTLLTLVSTHRYAGTPPRAATDPPVQFSAARALLTHARVLGDRPHPTGSAANAEVRARLLTELSGLGLVPRVLTAWQCGRFACALVHDVFAISKGSGGDGALLLAAHYDSVPAGPGAADDGAGVATLLEVTRALRAGPALAHDVILLFSDGEEIGLLGAAAFAGDPVMRDVRAVLNVEARGSRGPAMMFEAPVDAAPLIEALARADRPVSTSAFAFAYRQMPNDTDFSVFRDRGVPGLNFAFTEGIEHYHTPDDDRAHLDPRSLQHVGDTVLATTRALAERSPLVARGGTVAWFDVLGLVLVRYPRGLAVPLALVAALFLAMAARRARTMPSLGSAALALLAVVLALGGGFLVQRVCAREVPFVAEPRPVLVALHALPVALVLSLFARRDPKSTAFGVQALGVALSLVVGALAPDLSYVFLFPALVASVTLLLIGPSALAAGIGAVAQWLPCLFLVPTLIPTLGLDAAPIVAALVTWMLVALTPFVRGLRVARGVFGSLAVVAVALVLARRGPTFDRAHPQRVTVRLEFPKHGCARWVVDATWGGFPWGHPPSGMVGGPVCGLDPGGRPSVVELGTAEGARRVRLVPSSAVADTLLMPADVRVLRIAGSTARPVAHVSRFVGDRAAYAFVGVPAAGIELELEGASQAPLELYEVRPSVVEGGPARPPWAVPSQEGDLTLVAAAGG